MKFTPKKLELTMTLKTYLKNLPLDMRRALLSLDGCPVGGWPETRQAMRAIKDEMPSGTKWSWEALVNATTTTDVAGRYSVMI